MGIHVEEEEEARGNRLPIIPQRTKRLRSPYVRMECCTLCGRKRYIQISTLYTPLEPHLPLCPLPDPLSPCDTFSLPTTQTHLHPVLIRITILIVRPSRNQLLQIQPGTPPNIVRLALRHRRQPIVDIAILAHAARGPMLVEIRRMRIHAHAILRVIRAPPTQRVIENPLQLLDAQAKEDFLRAPETDRVGECANGAPDHVYDSRMIREVVHELAVVHIDDVVGAGDGYVVLDEVSPRIIFGDDVVAEAEPEDIPIIAVRGVGTGGGGGIEEVARAFGEVEEL